LFYSQAKTEAQQRPLRLLHIFYSYLLGDHERIKTVKFPSISIKLVSGKLQVKGRL
jgi:hypothetical protein